jgi:hypothetical protein
MISFSSSEETLDIVGVMGEQNPVRRKPRDYER